MTATKSLRSNAIFWDMYLLSTSDWILLKLFQNIPIYQCYFERKIGGFTLSTHKQFIWKMRSLLVGNVHVFLCEWFYLSTTLIWVKLAAREENKPAIYAVKYFYGEIKL